MTRIWNAERFDLLAALDLGDHVLQAVK